MHSRETFRGEVAARSTTPGRRSFGEALPLWFLRSFFGSFVPRSARALASALAFQAPVSSLPRLFRRTSAFLTFSSIVSAYLLTVESFVGLALLSRSIRASSLIFLDAALLLAS